jgi:transcriptional regulator NrdR family protein
MNAVGCPECGRGKVLVYASKRWISEAGVTQWRKKRCKCGHAYATVEILAEDIDVAVPGFTAGAKSPWNKG